MADRTIPNLRADDWYTITGRGRIAMINTEQIPGPPVNVGDMVRIDNKPYELRGVEQRRFLVDPPITDPNMGFVVQYAPFKCGSCGERYAARVRHTCPPSEGFVHDVLMYDWCDHCSTTFNPYETHTHT